MDIYDTPFLVYHSIGTNAFRELILDLCKKGKEKDHIDYPYVYGFTMIKDDTVFLVSTWEGTYIGAFL